MANVSQKTINDAAWKACDTFRGVIDPSQYKDYILIFLFWKYISDLWADHYAAYVKQYGDDAERIRRRLDRERFVLPEGTAFQDVHIDIGKSEGAQCLVGGSRAQLVAIWQRASTSSQRCSPATTK